MTQAIEPQKDMLPTFLETNLNSLGRISECQDNLNIFISNIILYCKLIELGEIDTEGRSALRDILMGQLNQLWFQDSLKRFSEEFKLEINMGEVEAYEKKLFELEDILRTVHDQMKVPDSTEVYLDCQREVNEYIQHLEEILKAEDVRAAIEAYDIYQNAEKQQSVISKNETSSVLIPETHFFKEKIETKINFGPEVFSYIRPQNHKFYISQAAKTYHDIAPFKIKNISLSISDAPTINRPNFFKEDIDESKAILHYCLPKTNKVAFYSLADVCKVHTLGRQYYQERQLSNQWAFGQYTRSVITANGKIFAVGCRTTKAKIDPYLYEITESKASNRGPIPAPKRESSLISLNNSIYVIGGQGDGEKCSRKNYRYDIKTKKWVNIAEANVALRKPTICIVANRYICKIGGLNEFDYINKVIEMYDTLTDRWSLVRASPRNIMEEIQILEDSHACQITDDQIYIFGGRNSNKFNTDTGFILMISEIREKKKGAAKVTGQFWNVSVGKRNILTAFGEFYTSGVVIQHNCIYGMRVEVGKALAP